MQYLFKKSFKLISSTFKKIVYLCNIPGRENTLGLSLQYFDAKASIIRSIF